MKRTILSFLLVGAIAGGVVWLIKNRPPSPPVASSASSQPERKILYYQSPMHPWIKSDKPGKCPICGMNLVLHRAQVALNVNQFDITDDVAAQLNKILPSVVVPPDGVSPSSLAPPAAPATAAKSPAAPATPAPATAPVAPAK